MYGIKRTTLEIDRIFHSNGMYSILSNVDYVSPTLPPHQGNAKLICLEDNDAVIKMLIKGRTNKLRHVPRTHRIDLDWLFEVLREDPGVNIKYINTKEQVADIFTKGIFTIPQWQHLAFLCNIAESSLSVDNFSKLTNVKHSLPCIAHCSALFCFALLPRDLVSMGDYRRTHHRIQGKRYFASGGEETPSVRFTVPAGFPDPYFILGVAVNASYETISSKYKEQAKIFHPDKQRAKTPVQQEANAERLRLVIEAAAWLRNEDRREAVDNHFNIHYFKRRKFAILQENNRADEEEIRNDLMTLQAKMPAMSTTQTPVSELIAVFSTGVAGATREGQSSSSSSRNPDRRDHDRR
jgi:hypothetical protein